MGSVEQCAGAFLAGEFGEGGEVFAEKKRGRGVAPAIARGDDAAPGAALRREQLRNRSGGKRRLIAERDERGVEPAGELAQRGDAGANRRGHAFGPGGIFRHEHGQAREHGTDFFGVCTEHHDDRPGGRRERGLDRAYEQRATADFEQLLRRAHARRGAGGEDDGAETKRCVRLTHGLGACVRGADGRRGR